MSAPTDSDLPALPATPTGLYRHYKGGRYEVLGCVRHSETLEPLVLYRALYGELGLWVRPHAMFFGTLLVDGVERQRFAPEIPDADAAMATPATATPRPAA
jgi:hypothetical protein